MDTDNYMDMNTYMNSYMDTNKVNDAEGTDDDYDYIAIIKNKTAYKDFVKNIDDTERDFDRVTQVHFGEQFNHPIDDLPAQVTLIKICKSFTYQHTIPETVKKVVLRK